MFFNFFLNTIGFLRLKNGYFFRDIEEGLWNMGFRINIELYLFVYLLFYLRVTVIKVR